MSLLKRIGKRMARGESLRRYCTRRGPRRLPYRCCSCGQLHIHTLYYPAPNEGRLLCMTTKRAELQVRIHKKERWQWARA